MYIRTNEGLGQGQATWSTIQTFNRHLGNNALEKSCWPNRYRYVVRGFLPNSAELNNVINKRILRISRDIVRRLDRDLPELKKLPQLNRNIGLVFHYEGHVDKTTDPKDYGKLDVERAVRVADYFETQISKEWDRKGLGVLALNRLTPGMGPNHPRYSTLRLNRRVEICFQPYVPDPKTKTPILLSPGDKIT